MFFGDPFSKKKLRILVQTIQEDTIDDLVAYNNQRLSNHHPIATFKRAWDETIKKYYSLAKECEKYSSKEIASSNLDNFTKNVIFAFRNNKFERNDLLQLEITTRIANDITKQGA